jgi:hypothetical protein
LEHEHLIEPEELLHLTATENAIIIEVIELEDECTPLCFITIDEERKDCTELLEVQVCVLVDVKGLKRTLLDGLRVCLQQWKQLQEGRVVEALVRSSHTLELLLQQLYERRRPLVQEGVHILLADHL